MNKEVDALLKNTKSSRDNLELFQEFEAQKTLTEKLQNKLAQVENILLGYETKFGKKIE